MKKLNLLFALLLVVAAAFAGPKKQNMRILFVGGSCNYDLIGTDKMNRPDSLTLAKDAQQRSASFVKMLKKYFKTVDFVDGKNYNEEMSRQHDVTVFDGLPKPVRERQDVYDEKGRLIDRIPAQYISEEYDCATVSIAEISEDFARTRGLKTDWYCLCLFGEALGWNAGHDVFKGPFEVKPETYMAPTPANAQETAVMFGHPLPAETEMFRVIDAKWFEAFESGANTRYRIGMVSRPDGFGDPDDEVISSGVCAKSIDAVAIGRHGNFFHWGFSASPDYLTPTAQNLLANCIVYAAKFNGVRPIARKVSETVSTRHWLDAKKNILSREGYESDNKGLAEFNKGVEKTRQEAREKKAKGEQLTQMEEIYLGWTDEDLRLPTYQEYLQQRERELYKLFGDNTELYLDYYEYNRPYFYCQEGYGLKIDEECRSLHMPNNDINTLDKCIKMLEEGRDADKAKTILERYTNCRFLTPGEWRAWFNAFRDKLFFSEGGMYKWYVNQQGAPGNELPQAAAPAKVKEEPIVGTTTKDEPVFIAAEKQGNEIVVKVKIHQGYHIYAKVSEKDPFIDTEIKFELPKGVKTNGKMSLPTFRPMDANGSMIYENDCIFRQPITGNGKGTAKITVTYQCCDNTICFPPTDKTLEVEL